MVYRTEARYIMPTYKRPRMVLENGSGVYLYDIQGRKYLDFIGGIATCSVGHANRYVVRAVSRQTARLINATNLFYTKPQVRLAKRLSFLAGFPVKAFFSNSGTESVECALKLARKHTGKPEIIAAKHGFHGRTLGALAATWKPQYKKPFSPGLPGIKHITYNSARAFEKAISQKTAAFIIEPIQGEEGVITPDQGYLKAVSRICKKRGVILIIDEIQTGIGRTGSFFAFQAESIKPDIITIAKGLANGIPIGVTLARHGVADSFTPGDHGSTFGGNSLSCEAALAVLDYMEDHDLVEQVQGISKYFIKQLQTMISQYPCVREIRGKGLMIGLEIIRDAPKIVEMCRKQGLLIGRCGENVLRFLPPLIITNKDVDRCIKILKKVFEVMTV